jgi:hypothetical protein
MTAFGGGGGGGGGTSGGGGDNSSGGDDGNGGDDENVCREPNSSQPTDDSSGDLKSVDPQGAPFDDPARPNYDYPQRPVVDHVLNRARGGHPTDPANLDVKTWEANSRKAGFEGNYTRDLQYYMRQGLSRADAESVLQGEADYIVKDVHARPIDPFLMDELPNQTEELDYENQDDLVCR